ncbi:MAG TPA: hypothetical protein DEO40_00130 [Treponema sp.]|jgi:hypothetical protein|nr:hypothetical protein [Treponema sp.]HCA19066.1 hypothetical protein [Treponema sp.]
MKKSFVFILASFFLFSCASSPEMLSFKRGGNITMHYVGPVDWKSAEVPLFSIDLTFFAGKEGIEADTSVKYTLYAKDFSKSELQKMRLSFATDEGEYFPTEYQFIYAESESKGVKIRQSASLGADESRRLFTAQTLDIVVYKDDGCEFKRFSGKELQKILRKFSRIL